MNKISILLIVLLISCASAGKVEATNPQVDPNGEKSSENTDGTISSKDTTEKNYDEIGLSSWYGEQFQNKPTASGELFDRFKLTAAHRTLPFGTEVRVHNLENKKETLVRINDRGPFNKTRIIDVSERAAEILDFKEVGVAKVGLTVIKNEEKEVEVAKKDTQLVRDEDDIFNLEDEDEEDEDEDDDDLLPPPKEEEPKKADPVTTPPKTNTTAPKTNTTTPKTNTATTTTTGKPKGYTVQVGVFKEKKRADAFKNKLKTTFNTDVYMYVRSGSYVVQIGDFKTRNEAVILRNKVKAKGIFGFIPPK
ncbi:MAG: septal ring lytic transglycosylase RlpA family protein [Leptospiraceae bacterium]|nr:septal ring lytic transglycosylase RlpA family protein [Leptospiraceae bacterium]